MSNSKVVLITGSSSGFGRLTAQTLAQAGYQVFASMRNLETKNAASAQEMRDWAEEAQVSLHLLELDVTDDASVNEAMTRVIEQAGRIDVLVNNAGFGVAGIQEAYTIEQVKAVFEVNVFGVLRMNRAVLPHMRKQHSGLIISISSGLGRVILPFTGPYAASKYALEALSENLHYELDSFGIDSLIIEPGAYPTTDFKTVPPADEKVLEEYGPLAEMPMRMFAGMAEMMKDNPPEPQAIADIVKNLIEMPRNQRPLRTVSGADVKGAEAINQVSAQVQEKIMGMFSMLSKQETTK